MTTSEDPGTETNTKSPILSGRPIVLSGWMSVPLTIVMRFFSSLIIAAFSLNLDSLRTYNQVLDQYLDKSADREGTRTPQRINHVYVSFVTTTAEEKNETQLSLPFSVESDETETLLN